MTNIFNLGVRQYNYGKITTHFLFEARIVKYKVSKQIQDHKKAKT